jgi:hypothetical protein
MKRPRRGRPYAMLSSSLAAIAPSTSKARTLRCSPSLANSSRVFFRTVARLLISVDSAASVQMRLHVVDQDGPRRPCGSCRSAGRTSRCSTSVGLQELKYRGRHFAKLNIATTQLVGDVCRDITGPALGGIEGDDAHRFATGPPPVVDQRLRMLNLNVNVVRRMCTTCCLT